MTLSAKADIIGALISANCLASLGGMGFHWKNSQKYPAAWWCLKSITRCFNITLKLMTEPIIPHFAKD
jgi:hypothetical protein